ncbi:MAG: hypothetical protein ACR2K1_03110 [Saprospiraceae bacterium]
MRAGAELGCLLAARTALPDKTYNTEAFFDLYKEMDTGLLFGLEYRVGSRIVVQMRGVLGLTPLFKGDFTDEDGNALPYDLYNRNVQLAAGYQF